MFEPKVVYISYKGRKLPFIAGAYADRVEGTYGVLLAEEIVLPYDFKVAIPDWGTPSMADLEKTLRQIIVATFAGKVVYIGCKGGSGRTGMVLAALHRVLSPDGEDSLRWVRANYRPSAVETKEQEAIISKMNTLAMRNALHLDPDGKLSLEEWVARIFSGLFKAFRLSR